MEGVHAPPVTLKAVGRGGSDRVILPEEGTGVDEHPNVATILSYEPAVKPLMVTTPLPLAV